MIVALLAYFTVEITAPVHNYPKPIAVLPGGLYFGDFVPDD